MLRIISFIVFFAFFSNADESYRSSYADIVEPLLPAVVNISVQQKASNNSGNIFDNPNFDEFKKFFEHFGQMPNFEDDEKEERQKPMSAGSGFIVSPEGYVVTNYHVIDQAEKIVVTVSTNKKYEAKLIGYDSRTDIALLKIEDKKPFPFVPFGDSNKSRVGDFVITIGNPFGLGSTVTSGIISAQARDIQTSSDNIIDNFIQTDAAINRGNSGGPMFNLQGQVIGINFAIFTPSGGSVGVGFAIPSSVAKDIVEQLKTSGKVVRGWLGVMIQSTEDVAEGLGLEESVGALVASVAKDSPAEKAGIKVGDIILKFDGKEITENKKLPRIVAETPVGKKVSVEMMSNGKTKTITLVVGEMNSKSTIAGVNPDLNKEFKGMTLAPITEEVRKKLNLSSDTIGVFVAKVENRSIAAKHGIKRGDIINSVNQKSIANLNEFFASIEYAKKMKRKSVMLLIYRSGSIVFLNFPI